MARTVWQQGTCWGVGFLIVCLGFSPVQACSTPVHRYALYRWFSYPFRVVYFYRGEEDPADKKAHDELSRRGASETKPANVELIRINTDEKAELESLPPFVREAWKSREDRNSPLHVIFTPTGAKLFAGRLTAADVPAMLESPARREMATLLSGECDGVLLFLPGVRDEDNKAALKAIDEAIRAAPKELGEFLFPPPVPGWGTEGPFGTEPEPQDTTGEGGEVAAGKGDGETASQSDGEAASQSDGEVSGAGADSASAEAETPSRPKVGLVKLSRDDKKETWLLRMLHAVEALEPDELEQPMVFATYGRGRVLEPYLGKGIEKNNLLDVIAFINGPCSCQVKDQNPGTDLLTSWDWDAAALKVARQVGEETGNRDLLASLLYQELEVKPQAAPEGDPQSEPEAAVGESRPAAAVDEKSPPGVSEPLEAEPAKAEQEPVVTVEQQAVPEGTTTSAPEMKTETKTEVETEDEKEPDYAGTLTSRIVPILGIALLVLAFGTIVILRGRRV